MRKRKPSPDETVVCLLAAGFFLGGSRRMAEKYPVSVHVGPITDWDLYGQDTAHARSVLVEAGFSVKTVHGYTDDQFVGLFSNNDGSVQVTLRKDVYLFRRVFESIDSDTFVTKLWKSSPMRDKSVPLRVHYDNVRKYFNAKFKEFGAKDSEIF